jgi:hypothetical protein
MPWVYDIDCGSGSTAHPLLFMALCLLQGSCAGFSVPVERVDVIAGMHPDSLCFADIDALPNTTYKFKECGYRCKIIRNQRTHTY